MTTPTAMPTTTRSQPANPGRATVLVADSHEVIRDGITARLRGTDWCEDVHGVSDGEAAIAATREIEPELLVLDIRLPRMGGFKVLDELGTGVPYTPRAVVFSAVSHRIAIARALETGATAYVSKRSETRLLVEACETVLDGRMFVDPSLAHELLPHTGTGLSGREVEVLELMAEGLPNDAIAGRIGIGGETVKTFVSRIMSKLGARTRTEAVARAFRMSLIE